MASHILDIVTDVVGAVRSGTKKPLEAIGKILGGGTGGNQKASEPQPDASQQQPSDTIENPEKAIKGFLKELF